MEIEIYEKITICLNMIVKNESKIIKRLFDSVLPIIDSYCICDTGSTDNTKEIIKDYFDEKNISGEIFDCSFQNFGYNRTIALKRAKNRSTYILLLDADMKVEIKPGFKKKLLTAPVYTIEQGSNTFTYYNTRLIKGFLDVTCVGPTHEYYSLPSGVNGTRMNHLYIHDIGDGGCKDNKFTRDIKLLREGIQKEPSNGRYYFYLGNSYYNTNQTEDAIEMYKKRIELGGWVEEVWYSYFRLGSCYYKKNLFEKAILTWLEGYNFYPKRSENIYEIVKHYRIKGKHNLSYLFYKIGVSIKMPPDNVLFLHHDVYNYLFDYELSIISYYLSPRPNALPVYMKLFNTNTNLNNQHLLSNFKFYCPQLKSNVCYLLNDTEKGYISSTPSIIEYKEGYLVNVRYVDYRLNNKGDYTYADGYNVHTKNKALLLDKEFKIKERKDIHPEFNEKCRIRGVEDVKIHSHGEKVYFMGTIQIPEGHKLRICCGEYDISQCVFHAAPFESPNQKDCEKNWALFSHQNDLHFIYEWNPLTIGKIGDESVDIIKMEKTPPICKMFRGSSNGFFYDHEYWFVCHVVEYSKPRHYYHCIIVLDGSTLNYKRHSSLFTFEGEKIEFCLSIIVKDDIIIMSHSCWDRTSQIEIYDKIKLLKIIFNV